MRPVSAPLDATFEGLIGAASKLDAGKSTSVRDDMDPSMDGPAQSPFTPTSIVEVMSSSENSPNIQNAFENPKSWDDAHWNAIPTPADDSNS